MEQYSNLEMEVVHLAQKYYEGKPQVSDKKFDELIDSLKLESPSSPVLQMVGWGFKVTDGAKHKYHSIGGIPKVKSEDIFLNNPGSWLVSQKLDGLTLVCYYENGLLDKVITRGDGSEGQDITPNIRRHIPLTLEKFTGYVRCEGIIKMDDFKDSGYKSPRNGAVGLATRKDGGDTSRLSVIAFGGYDASSEEFFTIESLEDSGFELVPEGILPHDGILEFLMDDNLPQDGLVCRTKDHFVAYKFDDHKTTSIVKSLDWRTHPTGKISSVIWIEPVDLAGCTIGKVSGKSYSYIRDRGLLIGDEIEVVRSGEVIPNWTGVIVSDGNARISPLAISEAKCSHGCSTDFIEERGANIYCTNPGCSSRLESVLSRLINHYAEKNFPQIIVEWLTDRICMDTLESAVHDLIDFPLVEFPQTAHQIKHLDHVLKGLNSREIDLHSLSYILGIEGLGLGQCQDNRDAWVNSTSFDYQEWLLEGNLEGFRSNSVSHWNSKLDLIKVFYDEFKITPNIRPKQVVRNEEKVCITGRLEGYTKSQFDDEVKNRGYQQVSKVDKTLKWLVCNDVNSNSSKAKKARELNIPIITQDQFLEEALC